MKRLLAFFLLSGGLLGAQTPSPGVTLSLAQDSLLAEFVLPQGMHQSLQPAYFGVDVDPAALPSQVTVGKAQFPSAPDTIAGLPSYSERVTVTLPVQFAADAKGFNLKGTLKWQLCYDDGICLLPQQRSFSLRVSATGGTWSSPRLDVVALEQGGPLDAGLGLDSLALGGLELTPAALPAPPVAPDAWSLLAALGLAFLGGLILNLMPCVLPVLSIKALSLIKLSEGNPRIRRAHAWATAVGILSSLLALALVLIGFQAVGVTVGWGVQFQNPWYIFVLLVVIWVFALSMFDVYTLPTPAVGGPGRVPGLAGSFFSGLLTVVLATPCTAPFLGTAVGLAFSSPWWVIVLVFLFIGLGLSLPFFLLTITPALNKWLPKPGTWMGPFKGVLGFALLATAVWLFTLLQSPWGGAPLSGVLWFLGAMSLVLWAWGTLQRSSWSNTVRWVGRGVLVLGLGLSALALLPWSNPQPSPQTSTRAELPKPWQEFDEARIQTALASGATVFIDLTADWCLTCKVNEAGALASSEVLRAFEARGVAAFRGDYTFADPVLARWLTKYARAGVPFYLVLHPDGSSAVLPEVLTPDVVISALN